MQSALGPVPFELGACARLVESRKKRNKAVERLGNRMENAKGEIEFAFGKNACRVDFRAGFEGTCRWHEKE
jgi:hypothetical protein